VIPLTPPGARLLVTAALATSCAPAAVAPPLPSASGSYLLTATDTGGDYAPTFTGNGYLGVRVPPAGQGYASGAVPAQSEVAGFYAQPAGQVQQRANVPTWSTLTFTDGGQDFSPGAGQVAGWRQQLNLHDGSITTTARWTAPNGHLTDLRYVVFTDRARPNLAIVRLELTPRWTGTATVTDLIDGTPATATTLLAKGWNAADHQQWETVRTQGLGVVAGLASRIRVSPDVPSVTDTPVGNSADQTVGQRLTFPVTGNRTVTLTKYVGVSTSDDTAQPESAARQHSTAAAAVGFDEDRDQHPDGDRGEPPDHHREVRQQDRAAHQHPHVDHRLRRTQLDPREDLAKPDAVHQVAVVQEEAGLGDVRVDIQVPQPARVERAAAADDAVNFVAF